MQQSLTAVPLRGRRDAAVAPEMPSWSQVAIDAAVEHTRAVFCDSLIT